MCLAIPGRLESVDSEDRALRGGRVRFGGILKEVSLACVPEAEIGDWVLVHVGMAISVVDEEEAKTVFEYLESMGELEELGDAPSSPGASPSASPTDAPPRADAGGGAPA